MFGENVNTLTISSYTYSYMIAVYMEREIYDTGRNDMEQIRINTLLKQDHHYLPSSSLVLSILAENVDRYTDGNLTNFK